MLSFAFAHAVYFTLFLAASFSYISFALSEAQQFHCSLRQNYLFGTQALTNCVSQSHQSEAIAAVSRHQREVAPEDEQERLELFGLVDVSCVVVDTYIALFHVKCQGFFNMYCKCSGSGTGRKTTNYKHYEVPMDSTTVDKAKHAGNPEALDGFSEKVIYLLQKPPQINCLEIKVDLNF